MDIALLGYGKMGKEIERLALQQQHRIVAIIDSDADWEKQKDAWNKADVAIDFSIPTAATENIRRCFSINKPIVVGTTGWYSSFDSIAKECINGNQTLFYATNFSIGVQLFFELNRTLARWMNGFTDYNPRIEEVHHINKLDAPSGTAITLAEDILANVDRKSRWENASVEQLHILEILSQRKGTVPGTHTVWYDSPIDTLSMRHEAKSREGFAWGALKAAEYCLTHHGLLTMKDMLNLS